MKVELTISQRYMIAVHKCSQCEAVPAVEFGEFPKIRLECHGCGKRTSFNSPEEIENEWNRLA